jgi:hypothetical protein
VLNGNESDTYSNTVFANRIESTNFITFLDKLKKYENIFTATGQIPAESTKTKPTA